MGGTAQSFTPWERATGKWQIPLLSASVLLLVGALWFLRPAPPQAPTVDEPPSLQELVERRHFDRAIAMGEATLARPNDPETQTGAVHLHLARAWCGRARQNPAAIAQCSKQITNHYLKALSHGESLTAGDEEQAGRAFESQNDFHSAIEHYQRAIERGVDDGVNLRVHVLLLQQDRLAFPSERLVELYQAFLTSLGDEQPDRSLWAIEKTLELLHETGRTNQASQWLAPFEDRFRELPLRDRFGYLQGLVLARMGHCQEAERHLRALRTGLTPADDTYAMSGWLLGRVLLDQGQERAEEAMSFFLDVLRRGRVGPYDVASRLGCAEALAAMNRHEEAIAGYRQAIDEMAWLSAGGPVDRDVLRSSLGVAADVQRRGGRLREAMAYARLAISLVDGTNAQQMKTYLRQLAEIQSLLAAELDSARHDGDANAVERQSAGAADEVKALYVEAAESFLTLGEMHVFEDELLVEASWKAAELHEKGGRRRRAIELYQRFSVEHAADPRVPRAMYRVGQLCQGAGELSAAVDAYQTCYQRFPRSLDGGRALVPLAHCYLAMGPEFDERAEQTLRLVLDDSELFTPSAPEFADALLLLGDVFQRRGEFERAITTLEEVLQRYPADPRVWRTRFLLADCYRQSGLAMQQDLKDARFAGDVEQVRSRLRIAADMFRGLIHEYESKDASELSRMDRMFHRHAQLYEADCYFASQEYLQALKLYDRAAGAFRDTPAALSAYVQIVNCHVFLSQPAEARAALARAVILADAIPAEAFEAGVFGGATSQTREEWKRYFEWLAGSELF